MNESFFISDIVEAAIEDCNLTWSQIRLFFCWIERKTTLLRDEVAWKIIIRAGCTLRGASSRTTVWHLHILNRRFWTVMRMGMYNSKRGTNRGATQRLKAVKNVRRSTDFPTTRSLTIKFAAVIIEPLHEFLISGENFSFSHYSKYRNSRFSSRWAPNKYLRSLAHPWFSIFLYDNRDLDDSMNARNEERMLFKFEYKSWLDVCSGFRARYRNTNSGISTTLTNETEWGYNTVPSQRTSSRLIREHSALALVQSRISMMRRARVHCFVNMDQWHVIDTYRRGMMAGARRGGERHLQAIKLRAWVIARVDHRSPLLFQAVSNKFDRTPVSLGEEGGRIFSFCERSRRFASTRLSSPPPRWSRVRTSSFRSFIKPSHNFPRRRLLSFVRSSAGPATCPTPWDKSHECRLGELQNFILFFFVKILGISWVSLSWLLQRNFCKQMSSRVAILAFSCDFRINLHLLSKFMKDISSTSDILIFYKKIFALMWRDRTKRSTFITSNPRPEIGSEHSHKTRRRPCTPTNTPDLNGAFPPLFA